MHLNKLGFAKASGRALRRGLAAWVLCAGLPLAPAQPLRSVPVVRVDPLEGRVWVDAPHHPAGARILLAIGGEPVGLLDADPSGDPGAFSQPLRREPFPPGPASAWLLPPDALAGWRAQWPIDAELFGVIESVAPGNHGVWIRRGGNAGVLPGDSWLLRVGDQPVARFDVRFVAPELCYGRAVSLVSDPPIRSGDRVALWPRPADRARGAAESGVVFVESVGAGRRLWIPWPPNTPLPEEPHVDVFRGDRYVGHAIVDQRDDRFLYARVISAARDSEFRIGDRAVVRTLPDVASRRLSARVFEVGPEGALVTASEQDGVVAGDPCAIYRSGVLIFTTAVKKVQREYALLNPPATADLPDFAIDDEVRFGPPPREPLPVAEIAAVVEGELIRVRVFPGCSVPLNTPLRVRARGAVRGVAVLCEVRGESAIGVLPSAGLAGDVAPGATIEIDP